MTDSSDETYWQSRGVKDQAVTVDFRTRREFGGLQISWLKDHHAKVLIFSCRMTEDLGKSIFCAVKQE